jgi:hypothetical protein
MVDIHICFISNIFFQGGAIWIRKASKMYNVLKIQNRDGTITAFYSPRFPPSGTGKIDTPSFLEVVSPSLVNYVVQDITPSNYSETAVGDRVFVEESINTAVLGIVIATHDGNKSHYSLIVRLNTNNSDIVVGDHKFYHLPYQLNRHGE